MKYSINSSGNMVAERDIYSLGGFIPKGSVGAKVANRDQISQDGECWVAGGDISARPDVRVKDNAYIGNFLGGVTGIHTDGITEFSGNTLIPGKIVVRNSIADPVNNFFVKDSFIGVSLDVLCGPEATATAFPFGQGRLDHTKPAGTSKAGMAVVDANSCFSNSVIRCGKDTQIYVPANMTARVLWAYNNVSDVPVYSGESELLQPGLKKVSHPTYKVGFVVFSSASAMTPADLLATGAKILGHISGSLLQDFRPESASGNYVMDKSSFIMNTDSFGLNTIQLRYLAGSMYDTNVYTKTDRQDYKPFGTFYNVERLEYTMYLSNTHRTNVNRDKYISAYDCPLLRVDDNTYRSFTGDLILRRCIVPKAIFTDNIHNGNVYEDIDFSYASDHLGAKAGNNFDMWSSHKQGEYAAIGAGVAIAGLISRPENLAAGSVLGPGIGSIPLDGSIMEQGGYTATVGTYYEDSKNTAAIRVRTGKPLPTFGAAFPTPPAGFKVTLIAYLGEDFTIQPSQVNPTTLETEYPYFVVVFGKADDSPVTPSEFIALNMALRSTDYTKVPEITGSAYVGAGCTVRGDVQLHGDPYVNRVLDVNLWEKGSISIPDAGWGASKNPPGGPTDVDRRRSKNVIQVEPGAVITCNSGYWVNCYFYDSAGNYLSSSGWAQSGSTVPNGAAFAGAILKKSETSTGTGYIEDSDIPLANVKYVRAFKKRRYIVNELDRTSPEDILLSVDYWEQGGLSVAAENAGKPYEELKTGSPYRVRLKRPFGFGAGYRETFSSGYTFVSTYYDAVTKLLYASTPANMDNALFTLVGRITDPQTAPITPADVTAGRLIIDFTPSPRIVTPYGASTLSINGPKIRMYDNAVLSRNLNQRGEIVLQGDAVMGYDFNPGECLCSNGHSDAIIKLP